MHYLLQIEEHPKGFASCFSNIETLIGVLRERLERGKSFSVTILLLDDSASDLDRLMAEGNDHPWSPRLNESLAESVKAFESFRDRSMSDG